MLWATDHNRLTITFIHVLPARILVGPTHLNTLQFDEWLTHNDNKFNHMYLFQSNVISYTIRFVKYEE